MRGLQAVLLFVLSGTLGLAWAAGPSPGPSPSPSSSPSGTPVAGVPISAGKLSEAIKSALAAFKPSLGELTSWQKVIFTDEMLASGEDFVREHRQVGGRIQVTLDEALIRKSLLFYAPSFIGNEQPRVAARIEAGERCPFCEEALPVLKKVLQPRLEHRAMRPLWFRDEEMPNTPAQGTPEVLAVQMPRFGFLRALEISRGLQGAVMVRIEPMGQVVDDSSHAEDGKYVLRLGMTLGRFTVSKKVEFNPTESVETLARRLWTESISELTDRGPKVESAPLVASGPPEVLLWVYGVRDAFLLSTLKAQIQLSVGGLTPVLERRLLRGKVLLAIRTEKPIEEIRSALSKVTVGSERLVLAAVAGFGKDPSILEGELK
jgi:hypothetical protein